LASALNNQINMRRCGMPAAGHVGDDVSTEIHYVLTSLRSARLVCALATSPLIFITFFTMLRALRITYFRRNHTRVKHI